MVELAELTSLNDKTVIEGFIRCIRNALWLAILRYRLGQGFWLGSGILLAAGIINVFFYKILISWSLIAALLPMVAGIFIALGKRPTMANAASHADSLFNGKSLMITANELLDTHTTPSGFSPWIMQQAASKAQLWHQQFKQTIYSKQNQFPWPAIAIALLGFYFILQTGVADKPQVKKIQSKTLTTDTKPALIASLIDEIRTEEKKLQQETPSLANELTEHFSSADQPALTEDAQSNKKQVDELSANDTKDNSQNTMTDNLPSAKAANNQSQQQNQQADAGIGTQADTNPTQSSANDIKNMSIKLVELELQNGDLVSSAGKVLPFKDHQVTDSNKRIKPPLNVASGHAFGAYTSHFSTTQQQYVTNYFKNSHLGK